jgi:hypothetical protein
LAAKNINTFNSYCFFLVVVVIVVVVVLNNTNGFFQDSIPLVNKE